MPTIFSNRYPNGRTRGDAPTPVAYPLKFGRVVVGSLIHRFVIPTWSMQYRKRYTYSLLCVGWCALLIFVSGCGGSATTQPPAVTPLTLSPGAGSPAASTATAGLSATQQGAWTTYHRDNIRSGYSVNETDAKQLTNAWKANLDGAVYAEPLVVNGHVIAVTEGDSLYALDARTGKVLWHTNVGTPVQRSTLPCGDIDPLGITGTPVYDPATGLIFAAAEISGPGHILVGVDATNGQVRVRRLIDVNGMEPAVHQQRAALVLANGMVYVSYGGLAGDCGNYHGMVVASRTDGTGSLLFYQLPTPREGGIWAPSGPAVDSSGKVYVAVGNGSTTSGNWDHTDSVLRLSSTLQLEDGFAPSQWQADNNSDADLGSMGPTLLPNGLLFIEGKSGSGYVLHANKLGGVGGQIQTVNVCHGVAMGGTASIGSQVFVPCSDGVRQITVGADGQVKLGWQAPSGVKLPPVIGGHTLYSLTQSGTLYALNSDTGAVRAQLDLGVGKVGLPHFVSPTVSSGHVFVGTLTGISAASIA